MVGASRHSTTGDGPGPDRRLLNRVPRWVKVVGIVKIALVLLMALVMHLSSGNGPGRHFGAASEPASPSSVR